MTSGGAVGEYLDPRQAEFLVNFLDKKSETFCNAKESALKAGYSESFAKNIMGIMPKWLSEAISDEDIARQAEKNVKTFLSDKEDDKKIKADMTKFVLRGLRKDKYSDRRELTQADGKDFPTPILGHVLADNSNEEDNSPEEED